MCPPPFLNTQPVQRKDAAKGAQENLFLPGFTVVGEWNMEEKRFLGDICVMLGLGGLRAEPKRLSGGFLHRMYSLETDSGRYAAKLLNPYIMKRDTAMENYRRAEELEAKLESRGLPVLPALRFHGKKMQELEGQYFYLFDWFDGKALTGREIRKEHCEKMGGVLAEIHRTEVRREKVELSEIHGSWQLYEGRLKEEAPELAALLGENLQLISDCQDRGNRALKRLPSVTAICHNDMDSKNVLWKGEEFRIIDLECMQFESPYMELFDLALNWSGYEECSIDLERFYALIEAYREAGGLMPPEWECLYEAGFLARLDWLEFNLKRTLGIEGGSDERELGASMVRWALEHLRYYAGMREKLLEACGEISHG